MLRRIILGLIIFSLLAMIVIWFLSGGPQSIVRGAVGAIPSLTNPFSLQENQDFRLPWQPAEIFATINISGSTIVDVDSSFSYENIQAQQAQELAALENEYDRLVLETQNERTFGTPSPYRGMVHISSGVDTLSESDPVLERIDIVASSANTGAIDITNWSLESALTRTRVYIPRSAAPYIQGTANVLNPTYLEPGETALIQSGASPVGISFRENMCSGYLQQFQSYTPALYEECPAPASVLPLTPDNLMQYGDACFDTIAMLEKCRFPQTFPQTASAQCRNYLANELSYNGCVARNRFRLGFHAPRWRVYLNAQRELWRNSHDAVRLLDANGKTVDVMVY